MKTKTSKSGLLLAEVINIIRELSRGYLTAREMAQVLEMPLEELQDTLEALQEDYGVVVHGYGVGGDRQWELIDSGPINRAWVIGRWDQ